MHCECNQNAKERINYPPILIHECISITNKSFFHY